MNPLDLQSNENIWKELKHENVVPRALVATV